MNDVFESHPMMRQLFARTIQHPVIGNLVEWVPTKWLLSLANPFPSQDTCLGNWGSNERVDWATLFENIYQTGMRDPFLVGVGRNTRRVRLEAGNHRVRCMADKGLVWLPAVAYVGDSAISYHGNGSHEGVEMPLKLPTQTDIMGPYPIKTYHRLSDVLELMPTLM